MTISGDPPPADTKWAQDTEDKSPPNRAFSQARTLQNPWAHAGASSDDLSNRRCRRTHRGAFEHEAPLPHQPPSSTSSSEAAPSAPGVVARPLQFAERTPTQPPHHRTPPQSRPPPLQFQHSINQQTTTPPPSSATVPSASQAGYGESIPAHRRSRTLDERRDGTQQG